MQVTYIQIWEALTKKKQVRNIWQIPTFIMQEKFAQECNLSDENLWLKTGTNTENLQIKRILSLGIKWNNRCSTIIYRCTIKGKVICTYTRKCFKI